MNKLGEYVKEHRQALGMSLREFGALCGVSHTHIDSIEKGYDVRSGRPVNPTSATLGKIAAALGVSEAELMGNKEEKTSSDELLKFALFGDGEVTDDMLEEVKQFARFVKTREDTKT